ncbi:MAG: DUF3303 domain-containing protein [Acidobacteriota bacterium]|nr:DUF3303 domain-containing protein [Acidobacteriota bacterium]
MLFMVVEHFKDEVEIYRRFREKGRMMPEGLNYVSSWIDTDFKKCFQLMETDDARIFDEWIANWNDIMNFEIFPVISSNEAAEKIAKRL